MRVLLLTQFYPPVIGGEERHVLNLAAGLARRGHDVAVATFSFPGAAERTFEAGVRVHRLHGTLQRLSGLFKDPERRHAPPFPDPELIAGLKRVLDEERPDVVHAHNWLYHSFLPLKPFCDVPLVISLHDYGLVCAKKNLMHENCLCEGPALSKCLPCAGRHYGAAKGAVTALGTWATGGAVRRSVDRFIAVSHAVARHTGLLRTGAPVEVIPNFVPDDVGVPSLDEDPRLRDLPENGFILFVGDLMRLKGVDVLLDAYARLAGVPPLVLIGRRCADTPETLPPNVRVFTMWPHAAVMHAWRRSLFGILPSIGPEACATVVIEAMACGKPVIASDIGGMPDLVEPGETGILVPPGDAAALARAIETLVKDRDLLVRMGAASLDRAETLKAGPVVARIETVYREVVRARNSGVDAGVRRFFWQGNTQRGKGGQPCSK